MRRPVSIPRPLPLALWLGVATLLLQTFGAALHAGTHHHHRAAATHSLDGFIGSDHGDSDHAEAAHADCEAHPSGPNSPHTPADQEHCLTCLKFTSDAKSGWLSAPATPTLATAPSLLLTLGAELAPRQSGRPVHEARGPPARVI